MEVEELRFFADLCEFRVSRRVDGFDGINVFHEAEASPYLFPTIDWYRNVEKQVSITVADANATPSGSFFDIACWPVLAANGVLITNHNTVSYQIRTNVSSGLQASNVGKMDGVAAPAILLRGRLGNGGKISTEIFIEPQKDWSVTRFVLYYNNEPRWSYEAVYESGNNFWTPREWTVNRHAGEMGIVSSTHFTATVFDQGVPVQDKDFQAEVSTGSHVFDGRTGDEFLRTTTGDIPIHALSNTPSFTSWWLAGCIGFCALLVTGFLWIQRQRSR